MYNQTVTSCARASHYWYHLRVWDLCSQDCYSLRGTTYGKGIGIGNGRRIFLPPLRSIAATAAFLRSFFLPASAPFGMNAAMTMATTAKMAKNFEKCIVDLCFVLRVV